MNKYWLIQLSCLASCLLFTAADWPQFRGSGASSLAGDVELPLTWSQDDNVAWKVELPGRGPSSPIIVNDRVFVTATSGFRQSRLHVLCYDAKSGELLWQRQLWATGRTATHESITGAAPTPASDGQHVYAFFSSNDLICLDLDGNLLWYRGLAVDYPKAGNDIGMASSPVLVDGVVVVQVESQGDSFAAGIDTATGETLWRVDRANRANWASPIALPGKGNRKTAVLLQSTDRLTAHDPRSGRELWQVETGCAGVPSAVFDGQMLFVPMNGLTALRLTEQSDAPEIVWDSNRMGPGSPSPIVHKDRVYVISNASIRCADRATGELLWSVRLKGRFWATPILAGDRLYCINQDGEAAVVRLGDQEGEIVGESRFEETVQASPAVSGDALYVRSDKHLWKISR